MMAAYFYCLTAVASARRRLSADRLRGARRQAFPAHAPAAGPLAIFLAKALAGVSLYLLAPAIPFVYLETWKAKPGNMPAPYHWQ